MAARIVYIFALSLIVFANLGESLKCYHCMNNHGGPCDYPVNYPGSIKECNKTQDLVCLFRNTSLIVGGGQIIRDCAPRSECDSRSSFVNDTCMTCTQDLCNSSSNVLPSLLTVCLLTFAVTIFISKIKF